MADNFFPHRLFLVLIFTSGTCICQSGCDSTIYIEAQAGKRLQLDCSTVCFQTNGFSWLNGSQVLESGYGHSYLVTNNVTISEVGGQNYSCVCIENNQRQCFSVWVYPEISLAFSSNPVMIGSSVNVTCTAVSYPQVNPHTDYIIQHPSGVTVTLTTAGTSGVIYEIGGAVDNDNGIYKCHVIIIRMNRVMTGEIEGNLTVINNAAAVPPEPTLKYYNYTLNLNQHVIIYCSVSAVPCPVFQWIQVNTNKSLPESSWNSTCTTYSDEKTSSTLNYTFEMTDLNEYCRIDLMCIATNPYGRSEQYFTLSVNTSKSCSVVSPAIGPSITWEDYNITNSIFTTTYALTIDASPTDFANTINNANEISIIGAVVGAIICFALIVVILIIIAVSFHKHKDRKALDEAAVQMQISSVNNEDPAAVEMRDNPAYQEISIISQENEPHIYERVT